MTTLPRLALLTACAVALTACTITSPTLLVSDAETVTPLPDTFEMTPYEAHPDGYEIADDEPSIFTRDGTAYVVADGSFTARFAPLSDDLYLLAATAATEGPLYGIARLDGQALLIRMVFASTDEALAMVVHDAPPDIAADIESTRGGIVVTNRATLDYLLARFADGTLETEPVVAWIGTEGTPAPQQLVLRDSRLVPAE
ncbi:hypothetical protein [Devosia sp.]|uniref:hypothetical protein n=1 Tax=Devosia sp. TaxID=1871048 RepID=UPI003A90B440